MEQFEKSNVEFVNCTPHAVHLNNGQEIPASGILIRISETFSEFDENGICHSSFGEMTGLPEPKPNTYYIVSAIVLQAAKALGRTDVVAPATMHPQAVRNEKGQIQSVPGFVR